MDGIYKNIQEYNPDKECKILIIFDDIIADMLCNKKLNTIVTEVVKLRSSKLRTSLVFHTVLFCCTKKY